MKSLAAPSRRRILGHIALIRARRTASRIQATKPRSKSLVAHYNHRRYHESIRQSNSADVDFGRGHSILLQRERIKRQTIAQRRLQHQRQTAQCHQPNEPEPPLIWTARRLKNLDDGQPKIELFRPVWKRSLARRADRSPAPKASFKIVCDQRGSLIARRLDNVPKDSLRHRLDEC
jgi:hypothetical protein